MAALKPTLEPERPRALTDAETAALDAIVVRRMERYGGSTETARRWAWEQVLFLGILGAREAVER